MQALRTRRGNVMIVVAVLCLLAFVGISSMDFLTRTDVSTTANLVRELKATYLAESIAAQIEGRANRHPWEKRFWWLEMRPYDDPLFISKSSGHVKVTGDLPENEYAFIGAVSDVDAKLREYRIVIEVTYQKHRYTFTWDKAYDESFLAGLNRDSSRLDKQFDEPYNEDTDGIIKKIKATAEAVPGDRVSSEFAALLEKLKSDERTIQGAKDPQPQPQGEPSLPPPPTIQPADGDQNQNQNQNENSAQNQNGN